MSTPRRSRRAAYRGLAQLQARAKAVAAEETEALLEAALDEDDQSFDEKDTSEGEDIVDSDFDDLEETPEDAVETVPRESRDRKRRYGRYVDPATKKSRPANSQKPRPANTSATPGVPARKSLRRSTKVASAKAAESRAQRRKVEAVRRARREAREAAKEVVRIPTQEELLEEAVDTEIKNRESLKELLRLEEEKKRLPAPKRRDRGPVVSTRSRRGVETVSFSKGLDPKEVMFPA